VILRTLEAFNADLKDVVFGANLDVFTFQDLDFFGEFLNGGLEKGILGKKLRHGLFDKGEIFGGIGVESGTGQEVLLDFEIFIMKDHCVMFESGNIGGEVIEERRWREGRRMRKMHGGIGVIGLLGKRRG